jgi:hypothetical protein
MADPLLDPVNGDALGICTSRAAAEEFIAGDPFVLNQMVVSWTVRPWVEARTTPSTSPARARPDGAARCPAARQRSRGGSVRRGSAGPVPLAGQLAAAGEEVGGTGGTMGMGKV